ncbi:uncharacterized protein LOC100370377 [Saccoglossus kowalevskii]|uniref:Uncharacterized protein LOC100370377 n=1 Tax=Saccoglossus kowalevskii TaxID=10224 RepID=A0ABM0GUP6_SACKO|nr:PREDICTED: uncharacterized protein LOC100370377 [Saccoglossus kowalevskii]
MSGNTTIPPRTVPDTRKVVPFDPEVHKSMKFDSTDVKSVEGEQETKQPDVYVDLAKRKLLTLMLGLVLGGVIIAVVLGIVLGTRGEDDEHGYRNSTTELTSEEH